MIHDGYIKEIPEPYFPFSDIINFGVVGEMELLDPLLSSPHHYVSIANLQQHLLVPMEVLAHFLRQLMNRLQWKVAPFPSY